MPAKRFGSQLDLQKIPLLGLVLESSATASPPATPVNGQGWYDTTENRVKWYENGSWVTSSNTGVQLISQKGTANGYASLDGSTKIPIAQIPTGTSSSTVALGNDARFSDSRTPNGSAGGSLTGSYPNPGIAAGAVGGTEIASNIKDPAAGTAGLRTLGTGAAQAMPGNTTLSSIAAPTSAVNANSQRITNLAAPVGDNDAATKAYVDSQSLGLDVKESVRVASTGNVTVTYAATGGASGRGAITAAPNSIDGVSLAAGNRVLLKDQSTGAQNGIWVVTTVGTGSNGVWDRATDWDSDAEVTSGAFMFVEEGTANADSGWTLTTNGNIIVGGASGTAIAFAQFSGAGQITAGNGLTKTGNTLAVGGTANRITVGSTTVDIASTYVGQTSITTLGTITTGTWQGTTIAVNQGGTGATTAAAARTNLGAVGKYAATLGALTAGVESTITHSLGTTDVQVQFRLAGTGYEELMSWRVIDANTVGVTADLAYSASSLRVVVVG